MMKTRLVAVLLAFALMFAGFAGAAAAQGQPADAWIQIEAQPTLRAAEAKAREWSARLDRVAGFRLPGRNWYAVALGPYTADEAGVLLRSLKASGAIPGDSFIMYSRQYGRQFWPVGGAQAASTAPAPAPQPQAAPQPAPEPVDETPAQARASERRLSADERKALQVALQWEGFYNAGIDGAFGPGTRRAMADWQTARGYEPTGVLTSRQRAELLDGYRAVVDSLGLAQVRDEGAGIEVILPMNMVTFDRYEAPFAHYTPINDSGVRVVLISQKGDRNTLYGLYDILQSLRIVPLEGPRERGRDSFMISGTDGQITSYTEARLVDGAVKGFTLIWPVGDERRRDMALEQMKASFASIPGAVLADDAGLDEATQSLDLLSGLEIRRPDVARSGFYVSGDGAVVTVPAAVENCARITLDDQYEADLVAADAAAGVALVRPRARLAPLGVAAFRPGPARLGAEVAVAGYSYEGRLSAPTLSFGTLADLRGLAGEDHLLRLSLRAEPGDAGGPVLDGAGAVIGMLLPRAEEGARRLPEDVNHALAAPALTDFLAAHGVRAGLSDGGPALDPVDLSARARAMTVLVSCWN